MTDESEGAPENRTASEILRDPNTYEVSEALLYISKDGHLTETSTEFVAGTYIHKTLSDERALFARDEVIEEVAKKTAGVACDVMFSEKTAPADYAEAYAAAIRALKANTTT